MTEKSPTTTTKFQLIQLMSFEKLSRVEDPSSWKTHFSKQRKIDLSRRIKLSPQIIVFIPFGKGDLLGETSRNNKPKLDQKGKDSFCVASLLPRDLKRVTNVINKLWMMSFTA